MKVRFRSSASLEISRAADWYEKEFEAGTDFLDAVEKSVGKIAKEPFFWKPFGKFRRYKMKRFPYYIFYTAKDDLIVISGVFHEKRDPSTWQNLLKNR